ncbi:TonB-dependent receptor plug domain-containing protein [Saccharicrinis fermentans]|uniref:Outer-membrane receptor n=1 Tax=Saccharicrinis fermentans DSM 9555 = JCM 21142 TaxID=869213 RepID=W7Y6D0_9BACT|nr:TonB-dependent receptor plug domain-containing protein [Saccharicrinis fermentans]GAF03752.1 outer-membrane receptor [Saccharicrinis fermentans DSM 9555 = JCM 21142]
MQEIDVQEESIHPTEESLKVMAPLKDIPITTSTVTRSLLDQRQVWNLNEAVKYTTGISPSLNYGGFQTFTMRGFRGPVIMVDGARDERMNLSNSAPVTSLASVEKIEYLKGPAAILYGHSAVGGILNIVRKKPTEAFTANMTATYGSWNTKEVNAGAGGAINSKR